MLDQNLCQIAVDEGCSEGDECAGHADANTDGEDPWAALDGIWEDESGVVEVHGEHGGDADDESHGGGDAADDNVDGVQLVAVEVKLGVHKILGVFNVQVQCL